MRATAVRSSELAFAAYGLALRITRDEQKALASLETATLLSPDATGAAFLRRVRNAARLRRVAPDPATAPRPPALAGVALPEWTVLERVAHRGMSVTEAAEALGIERCEALRLLDRGLRAAGDCLGGKSGEGQPGGDAQAVRRDVLGLDLAAGGLDDPTRDRKPEPAPVFERRR